MSFNVRISVVFKTSVGVSISSSNEYFQFVNFMRISITWKTEFEAFEGQRLKSIAKQDALKIEKKMKLSLRQFTIYPISLINQFLAHKCLICLSSPPNLLRKTR